MKILPKTKEVPSSRNGILGVHQHIWKATETLKDGEWLPVECKSNNEARSLAVLAYTKRTGLRLQAKVRGKIVYIRVRP